jgi:TPR repeat protein
VSQSQYNLGLIFNLGGYFKRNIEMAKYWYKKAAFNESA